jgi:ABC-type phosphate transport system auxiliary subunit
MSNGCLERLLHKVTRLRGDKNTHVRERETSRVAERISSLYKDKCSEVVNLRVEVETLKLQLDLMKDQREGENELELNSLKLEVKRLREAERWQDASYDRLFKVKETLRFENRDLEEQLENLRLSKKERRQKKKDRKNRK